MVNWSLLDFVVGYFKLCSPMIISQLWLQARRPFYSRCFPPERKRDCPKSNRDSTVLHRQCMGVQCSLFFKWRKYTTTLLRISRCMLPPFHNFLMAAYFHKMQTTNKRQPWISNAPTFLLLCGPHMTWTANCYGSTSAGHLFGPWH